MQESQGFDEDEDESTQLQRLEAMYEELDKEYKLKDSENEELREQLNAIQNGLVCNWNGSNYSPYNIRTNNQIGLPGYGYKYVKNCNESVKMSNFRYACNWTGIEYAIYDINNNTRAFRIGFTDHINCGDFIQNMN